MAALFQPTAHSSPAPPFAGRRRWGISLIVLAAAFGLRAAHVLLIADTPYFGLHMGDAAAFHRQALAIAGGEILGTGVLFHAPGYPYLLGVVYAVLGSDPLAVRLFQALVGAGSAVLIAQAAGRLFDSRVALAAGLVAAVYGPGIFYDTIFQDSVVDLLFGSLALWALAEAILHRSTGRLLLLGFAIGLFSLSREFALSLLPLAAVWAATGRGSGSEAARHGSPPARWPPGTRAGTRGAVRRVGAVVLGATLAAAPLIGRNLAVDQGVLPGRQIQFGVNLFIGNGQGADGLYHPVRTGRGDAAFEYQDALAVAEERTGRPLTPAEASRYWTRETLADIAGAPLRWAGLTGRKALLTLSRKEFADTEGPYLYARNSLLLRATLLLHFGVLLALAVLGLARAWPRRRQLWVLFAWPAAYLLGVVAFFVFGRYRHPAFPALAVLAGAGIIYGIELLRERRLPAAVSGLAALGVLALSYLPIGPTPDRMQAPALVNVGAALENRGAPGEAGRHYALALQVDPGSAQAAYRLGDLLRRTGRVEEGLPLLEAAHRGDPRNPVILNDWGIALASAGRPDSARQRFRQALQLDPLLTQPRVNLARLDLAAGDTTTALGRLHAAVERAPRDPVPWAALIDLALATDTEAVLGPVLGPDAAPSYDRVRGFLDALRTILDVRDEVDGEALARLAEAWAGPERGGALYRELMARLRSR